MCWGSVMLTCDYINFLICVWTHLSVVFTAPCNATRLFYGFRLDFRVNATITFRLGQRVREYILSMSVLKSVERPTCVGGHLLTFLVIITGVFCGCVRYSFSCTYTSCMHVCSCRLVCVRALMCTCRRSVLGGTQNQNQQNQPHLWLKQW